MGDTYVTQCKIGCIDDYLNPAIHVNFMRESRTQKSLLNAKVDAFFLVVTLVLTFFSRKIFLSSLGVEYVGLTSTLSSLLDVFNLAELGIGAAIGYVLYKPLFYNDRFKINEIISVLGYLYRCIGFFIFSIGILVSLFIPLIFPSSNFSYTLIYCVYYVFLISSLLGYFINYRQNLLGADQRNYIISGYSKACNILKTSIQMGIAYYTGNYYLWVIIELIFGVIYTCVLNYKIKQVYPWLKTELKEGRALLTKYPEVTRYAKQLFIQKIGYVVQWQVAPFLTYVFTSLQIVALYGNYTTIVGKTTQIYNTAMDGTTAGVGNLIAEGNKEKIMKVFWELNAMRYYFTGILVICIYMLIEPFISLWLGDEYLLDKLILFLICMDLFIGCTRGGIGQFLFGYGLFSDVWAPVASALINFTVSCICGWIWGLSGVLLGCVVAPLIINHVWKPYYLYRSGFKESIWDYCFKLSKICILMFSPMVFVYCLMKDFSFINPKESFTSWIVYALIVFFSYSTLTFLVMFLFSSYFRSFIQRFRKIRLTSVYD